MVDVRVEVVRDLQILIDDASVSIDKRSLEVRRFCNEYKPSAPGERRVDGDGSLWTKVDTDYLLTISSDMPVLANYLVERVVAAT